MSVCALASTLNNFYVDEKLSGYIRERERCKNRCSKANTMGTLISYHSHVVPSAQYSISDLNIIWIFDEYFNRKTIRLSLLSLSATTWATQHFLGFYFWGFSLVLWWVSDTKKKQNICPKGKMLNDFPFLGRSLSPYEPEKKYNDEIQICKWGDEKNFSGRMFINIKIQF